jgi:hypothetical protein
MGVSFIGEQNLDFKMLMFLNIHRHYIKKLSLVVVLNGGLLLVAVGNGGLSLVAVLNGGFLLVAVVNSGDFSGVTVSNGGSLSLVLCLTLVVCPNHHLIQQPMTIFYW